MKAEYIGFISIMGNSRRNVLSTLQTERMRDWDDAMVDIPNAVMDKDGLWQNSRALQRFLNIDVIYHAKSF